MHTLARADDDAAIRERISRLRPDLKPQWGRMSCGEMVCHLTDSFHVITGERKVKSVATWVTRTLLKRFALWVPLRWPPGYPTRPELDQSLGHGTRPADFERDRERLLQVIEQVVSRPKAQPWAPHPGFGPMTTREVMRWGYLHADHHLRQFGV